MPHNNATPLRVACEFSTDIKIIKLLIEHKADVNILRGDGKSNVEILFERNRVSLIPPLIINANEQVLYTYALHISCANQKKNTRYIVKHNADVNAISKIDKKHINVCL